jgi:sugar lactone lactonase YvrE
MFNKAKALQYTHQIHVLPIKAKNNEGLGPEDIAILPDGRLITGLLNGKILMLSADGSQQEELIQLKGRPLGIEILDAEHIVVCDGQLGQLLKINILNKTMEVLVERIAGQHIKLCNNASVAQDGRIFFSCSSTQYTVKNWQQDLIRHAATGSLHCRYPDGRVTTVLDGLAFANGVTLTQDESKVLVAETGRSQIMQVDVVTGQASLFASLLGAPDNLSTGPTGIIWVALPSANDLRLQLIHKLPRVARWGLAQTVGRIKLPVKRFAQILGYDSRGHLLHDIRLDPQQYHMITSVREHAGKLYLGSLHERAIAVVQL